MDYGRLNRKVLQALCKEHGIPANKTNVFMAEALGALPKASKEREQMMQPNSDPAEVVKSKAKSQKPKGKGRKSKKVEHESPFRVHNLEDANVPRSPLSPSTICLFDTPGLVSMAQNMTINQESGTVTLDAYDDLLRYVMGTERFTQHVKASLAARHARHIEVDTTPVKGGYDKENVVKNVDLDNL